MCTGIEAAAIVATLAGTGAQIAASEQEKSAMNARLKAEMQRQAEFAKKGKATFQASLGESGVDTAKKQINEGALKATQEYKKVQSGAPVAAPLAVGKDKDQVVQGQRNQAYLGQMNQNAAGLQGYDTFSLLQAIKNLRANTQLGQISNFAQRSQQVLPFELQDASRSAAGLHGIGSILSTIGGLAGMYGAMSSAGAAAAKGASSAAAQNAMLAQAGGAIPVGGVAATQAPVWGQEVLNPALLKFGTMPAARRGFQLGVQPSTFNMYGGLY